LALIEDFLDCLPGPDERGAGVEYEVAFTHALILGCNFTDERAKGFKRELPWLSLLQIKDVEVVLDLAFDAHMCDHIEHCKVYCV